MKGKSKQEKMKRVEIRLTEDEQRRFQEKAESNGQTLPTRARLLIQRDIEKGD